jgi:hypothetical protein
LGDYSASVNWDGSSSAGSITVTGGMFTVSGSHKYAEEGHPNGGFMVPGSHTYTRTGTFTFTVTIVDRDGSRLTVKGTATVGTGPIKPPAPGLAPAFPPLFGDD